MRKRRNRLVHIVLMGALFCPSAAITAADTAGDSPSPMIGAYYFDGWAGKSFVANDPRAPWAANPPTHLRPRMVKEFPDREPIWGWRDDSVEVMERQIDIAADHGVGFFAFCWYWHDNGKAINEKEIQSDSLNRGLELFLKANNNHRMRFCLLIANHDWFEINGWNHIRTRRRRNASR